MHETGVCRDIVETVEMSALRGHAKRVVEVRLKLGEVHDVVPEILSGAFEWMARGTVAEGARLVIERVPKEKLAVSGRRAVGREDVARAAAARRAVPNARV